jgi:hypothetical protein
MNIMNEKEQTIVIKPSNKVKFVRKRFGKEMLISKARFPVSLTIFLFPCKLTV